MKKGVCDWDTHGTELSFVHRDCSLSSWICGSTLQTKTTNNNEEITQ